MIHDDTDVYVLDKYQVNKSLPDKYILPSVQRLKLLFWNNSFENPLVKYKLLVKIIIFLASVEALGDPERLDEIIVRIIRVRF